MGNAAWDASVRTFWCRKDGAAMGFQANGSVKLGGWQSQTGEAYLGHPQVSSATFTAR